MSSVHERFESIACEVCGKSPGLSGAECYRSIGQSRLLCREHGRCRVEEKTQEQFGYVVSSASQCTFLRACPGSGKTEVVGLKAAYEIRRWQRSPGGVAVLSFTNNAADVIRSRVQQFLGVDSIGYPHYVGTIDSSASRLHREPVRAYRDWLRRRERRPQHQSLVRQRDSPMAQWLSLPDAVLLPQAGQGGEPAIGVDADPRQRRAVRSRG